jgi:hypothetical protein
MKKKAACLVGAASTLMIAAPEFKNVPALPKLLSHHMGSRQRN